MNTKLIIVEGLPGFGKSTIAQLVSDILTEMNIEAELFKEGNLDHPADYDGVAYYANSEFESLLSFTAEFRDILSVRASKQGHGFLLFYRKIEEELGIKFPDELLSEMTKNDIYELPLDQHMELITGNWEIFTKGALNSQRVYVFECCLIQNPVTMGMIKYNSPEEKVINYVIRLAKTIACLNPLFIYIGQNDLEFSFSKAVKERPKEWSDGFIDYYTGQGYGKAHGYTGLDGTIQVLQARAELEMKIRKMIKMEIADVEIVEINNSSYNYDRCRSELIQIMKSRLPV